MPYSPEEKTIFQHVSFGKEPKKIDVKQRNQFANINQGSLNTKRNKFEKQNNEK